MAVHLRNAIEDLKKRILFLSAVVEENFRAAVTSLTKHDFELAQKVIEKDHEIDRLEIELEEECLKLLALHQPVAIDLRFIVAVLKINNDLERIGDEAVNLAERASFLAKMRDIHTEYEFENMAEKVQFMLKKSLDALVQLNSQMARDVCILDDEVDKLNHDIFERVKDEMRANPERIDALVLVLGISRHLERIADHATNIAEDVVYMIEGIIMRHRNEDYTLRTNQDKS